MLAQMKNQRSCTVGLAMVPINPMNREHVFKFCPRCAGDFIYTDNHFKCAACGLQYYLNPAATVAVLIKHADKILLVRRAREPLKGMLSLPGGFIERYETAEEAAAREIKEELNLDVTSLEYVNSDFNDYDYGGVTYNCLGFAYWATIATFHGMKPQDDVAAVEWWRLEDIKIEEVAFGAHQRVLEMLQDGLRRDPK